MLDLLTPLLPLLAPLADVVPEDDDVVAGVWGAVAFAFLILATIALCYFFIRQMRTVERRRRDGVYGPVTDEAEPADQTEPADS